MLESILKEGEIGKRQDLLLYGKEYHLYRNGKYIGIATYTEDENIGDSFISNGKTTEGEDCFEVYRADEWIFV